MLSTPELAVVDLDQRAMRERTASCSGPFSTASSRCAMEILYFTLAAIVLYVVSDWALKRMEAYAGRRFEHRTLIFFAIILGLALASFALIRNLTGA
jgi:hypothetical protein